MTSGASGLPFDRVGGYELVRRIGAGGMGEVYLARDPRLERQVAIKLLPGEFSRDSVAVGRFRQEALTLASLNHPNIATIHGFDEAPDGSLALILEHVEGESLSTRLERGALPISEALTVCSQVAEALEAAHERGIVHRDLKPGNVMVTPRGLVKVLDFGLAVRTTGLAGLSREDLPDATGPETAPAESSGPTSHAGVWMGTPGYMSPEQLVMGEQDQRGDVFAFGILLFECLAGRRAFEGRDDWELMAKVLNESPDPAALPARLPPRVHALLDQCLDKQVETRIRDLRMVRIEIEEVLGVRRAAALRTGEAVGVAHNLPHQATSFVGRQAELELCGAELARTRMLTLLGMGGSGKTRLALQLAATALDDHPDGVWFADLSGLQDSARVIELVALAMGVPAEPGRPLDQSLAEHVAERRMLLLMDNCEGVLAGCRELSSRLLAACGALRILATSREALGVSGESVHAVPPLSVPTGAPGEDAAESEAVRLFVARAEAARSGFTLSPDQLLVVSEISRRLDGIPLALELAAARVRVLGVEQILARLGDRFRLLTASQPGGDRRHLTLKAAIEWSTDQLAPDERAMFRAMAVFVGSWSLESAVAVSGDHRDEFEVLDTLQRLADKSLVVLQRTPAGDARYRYLESVRQLASEMLAADPGAEACRDRHLDRYVGIAEGVESRIAGAGQKDLLLELDLEHADVLAAHAWSEVRDEGAEKALRLAAGMHRYWSARGQFRLGRRTLERSLERAGALAGGAVWATACVRVAGFALYENDPAAARPLLEQSLEAYRQLADEKGVARALHGLGTVAIYQRDYATARTWILEVVAHHRGVGDRRALASALHNLGEVAVALGDLAAARDHYGEALVIFQAAGDDLRSAHALEALGSVHMRSGDLDAARTALWKGLHLAANLAAPRETALGLECAAELAAVDGAPELAPRWLGAASALRGRYGLAMLAAEREEQDRVMEGLRARLDERVVAMAYAEGGSMALEASVASVLGWLQPVKDPGPLQ